MPLKKAKRVEPGDRVAYGQPVKTLHDLQRLKPGTVVTVGYRGRLIHLHDDLWLYCCGPAWHYGPADALSIYLPGTISHVVPPAASKTTTVHVSDLPLSGG